MEVIKDTVLLNYELTSVKGVKKPKISEDGFIKRIMQFKKIWSEEHDYIDAEWIIDELKLKKVRKILKQIFIFLNEILSGASEGSRTLDLNVGNVSLYH